MNFPADHFERIKNGDEHAFEQLFRSLYPSLCAYANKYLTDHDQAEEVVQEVFYKIWSKRKSLEIKGTINAYLYRAVKNACINQLNHQKVRQTYISDQLMEQRAESMGESDLLQQTELEHRIAECLSKLPPERQKIFRLSREEELKYKEIAEKLGISIKTVEVQMGKALKSLKNCLKDYLMLLVLFILTLL